MAAEYDFIVVGAGPSGCAVATRLATSASRPSVLLVEAGGDNKDAAYLVPADRFNLAFSQPQLNWGYKTAPQTHLNGQEIDYSRGKGLGGSTAINFACWIIGADEDYDEWARRVGDDAWSWKNVKERFKKIESYHVEVPQEYRKYISPKAEDHGTNGPLELSYAPDPWEKGLADVFIAAQETGLGVNPDVNAGNPIGMGMGAWGAHAGARTTASAYLRDAPANLTLALNSAVARVLVDDGGDARRKTAVGVRTVGGEEFRARRDVVLSGGALNTPQLLMLSGIGPSDELEKHKIPLVHELPGVGKNLQDHGFSTVILLQKPGTNDRMRFAAPEAAAAAAAEAAAAAATPGQPPADDAALPSSLYGSVPMGWFKSEAVYASDEFKALDAHTQRHLRKPTVPSFEFATHTPPLFLGDYELQPTDSYLTGLAFVMNPQSHGAVTLASADPSDAPLADPRLVSHPYDRRVLIEGVRALMAFFDAPVFRESRVRMVGCPRSRSDEDIWEHCKGNMFSSWHMCSTARMGREEDPSAVVDTEFRVRGVGNLRVVDLSVLPLLPNNHTQSTAYLVGETAAEKIIAEYGL